MLYCAGAPRYAANFSRDSLTYALLAEDLDALRAQVEFSAGRQGRRRDPETGEEPGKIHHELPGARIRDLSTAYNACDTTALFVIAVGELARHGELGIAQRYRENVARAVGYFHEHIYDGVFHEDTKQSGGERFALKVTYWKDSDLNVAGEMKEPTYPIAYALPHFQCQAALRCAARLLGSGELEEIADEMTARGFETFWRDDHFAVAVERHGAVVDPPSSDSLHSLLYIRPGDIARPDAQRLVHYSEQLATPYGYLAGLAQADDVDEYHTRWVWVHEQSLLHSAARRHGLDRAEEVATRIVPTLDRGFPELIDPSSGGPRGNSTQLWSIGAHVYFGRARTREALGRLARSFSSAP